MVKIWCLVNGQSSSQAFSVVIDASATIEDLKDAIKDKKLLSSKFNDIAADGLTLWRVSIPVKEEDEDDDENDDDEEDPPIMLDSVPEKKKLRSTSKISRVFRAELPEETIHVIVQLPQSGNATYCSMQAF
ncbi:hypothetical protein BGX34_012097 [Mortierella sp. NVP85]|nr:hypothetical protein BGX34_012097 [Mortierella sp. NVP85]